MKLIKTTDAVGHILCHDLTQIIKDEYKGARFKKGYIVKEDDIPVLLSMGKEHLYVWEHTEGTLHENDAALRLASICNGINTSQSDVSEGKIELLSDIDGVVIIDTNLLYQVNSVDEIMVATVKSGMSVKKGQKLCGTRVIPLVISEDKIEEAEQICSDKKIVNVYPYINKTAGIITTGKEVFSGKIDDKFTPVVIEKLAEFGVDVIKHITVDDNKDNIVNAIKAMREADTDIILCTGGMSVDPDDNTPGAIKESGANIITYGAPVLPGAMFLLGYFEDKTPIVGLPGCVMYAKATVFDLALPRIIAGLKMNKTDFIKMGEGGLCMNCDVCEYPKCPFGK